MLVGELDCCIANESFHRSKVRCNFAVYTSPTGKLQPRYEASPSISVRLSLLLASLRGKYLSCRRGRLSAVVIYRF